MEILRTYLSNGDDRSMHACAAHFMSGVRQTIIHTARLLESIFAPILTHHPLLHAFFSAIHTRVFVKYKFSKSPDRFITVAHSHLLIDRRVPTTTNPTHFQPRLFLPSFSTHAIWIRKSLSSIFIHFIFTGAFSFCFLIFTVMENWFFSAINFFHCRFRLFSFSFLFYCKPTLHSLSTRKKMPIGWECIFFSQDTQIFTPIVSDNLISQISDEVALIFPALPRFS